MGKKYFFPIIYNRKMDYLYLAGVSIVILLTIYIIFLLFCPYSWNAKEAFENRLSYGGQSLVYNNNPRDPSFNYITFTDAITVQNPMIYANKSAYSIDF
jgi:hypothetical protein